MHATPIASASASPRPLAAPAFGRQAYACADDRYTAALRLVPTAAPAPPPLREVYQRLMNFHSDRSRHGQEALHFLQGALAAVADAPDDLPETPEGLVAWMQQASDRATAAYAEYLAQRKAGAPRRYFSNRTHALYFLQAVAPTKLVDGAWLYGTLRHARDPRLAGLAQTYLEELGNGDDSKNHVLLYRQLLQSHGLGEGQHLPDAYFHQGAIQLALGHSAQQMLPEVIGFNLGYEQLPLHLLITAYELNELGIDPYYFTLHVTVDNADSGHARKAVDAVFMNAARYPDAAAFWRRVRSGYRLNDLGVGTTEAIRGFDIDAEVIRFFMDKSKAGAGAHSDYCRIEGRTVNEWLQSPTQVGAFLQALERKGWIVRGAEPQQSRFWQLLVGERAEMFGVFSDYELQAIHDWMRGAPSADGRAFDDSAAGAAPVRSFRAQQRLRGAGRPGVRPESVAARIAGAPRAAGGLGDLSPETHWTPEGLATTRVLVADLRGR